jgi:uncharacterized protein
MSRATLVRMHDTERPRPTIPLVRRAGTALLLGAAAAAGARAASFDCKAAKTPTEKVICGSPELSALDERLAQDYKRALHALSPAGAARLKESQRSWLRFSALVCTPRMPATHGEGAADCLSREFAHRLGQLEQAGIRIGPYVFNRIDDYAVRPSQSGDDTGYNKGFVTQHIGYPQIDAPLTAAATAWNEQQRQVPGSVEADDDTDDDVEVKLGCVGARFISAEKVSSEYAHGTAHGVFDREKRSVLLVPTLRDMTADDLFAEGSGWEKKLPALFRDAYLKGRRSNENRPEVETAILESAADPASWLLTAAGMQISLGAYEAGCYACNPGPITVPWTSLKPLLATTEFTACKAPPAATP